MSVERKFKVGGTTYQRSKRGVGKEIGGKLYVHKLYVDQVMDLIDFIFVTLFIPRSFNYNCVMIDEKNRTIRFDEAPDFDTAREPHVGDFIEVNLCTLDIRHGHSDAIWHHKWMWVDDDYNGFDVEESYQWSKKWTSYIRKASGSERIWLQQLKEANID